MSKHYETQEPSTPGQLATALRTGSIDVFDALAIAPKILRHFKLTSKGRWVMRKEKKENTQ